MSARHLLIAGLWLGLATAQAAGQGREAIPILDTWTGKVADAKLLRLVPKSSAVTNAQEWRQLWTGWGVVGRLPQVDFSKRLILIGTAMGPNSVFFRPTIGAMGAVNYAVGATKVAGPGFGYAMVLIDRDEVKTVNGVAIPDGEEGYVRVEIRGKLRTGIAAIGGETTGTTITAGPITWELDISGDRALQRRVMALDGKMVTIKGELEKKRGVEIRERWIVHVKELAGE